MSIIQEFQQYIKEAICRPDDRFKGWPICPYACNARIHYAVADNSFFKNITNIVDNWDCNNYDVLIVLFKGDIFVENLQGLCDELSLFFPGLEIFAGHPISNYVFQGVYTRRDPYPNLQFNKRIVLDEFRDKLKRTNYYESLA